MSESAKMPIYLDRKRLKDRIVENISKAVKQIQELKYYSDDAHVKFTNEDWPLCRLVEHLDHALLHGLRHISSGYWVVVRDFTHKSTVKEINQLGRVTTNLGKGRAWLYTALNEQLLESYLRCYMNNPKLVSKYYAKEAVVQDQQQMEILVTLSSGLEYVTFELEIDMPYLDLSSHQRKLEKRRSESDDEVDSDRMSLCSMDSSLSMSSNMTGGESLVPGLTEVVEISEMVNGEAGGSSASSYSEAGPTRMTRVSNIECRSHLDLDVRNDEDLEVIHVKKKKSKRRSAHKKRPDGEWDQVSISSYTPSPSPITPNCALSDFACGSSTTSTTDEPGDLSQSGSPKTLMEGSKLPERTLEQSDSSSNLMCNIDTRESRIDSSSSLDSKSRASSDVSNTNSSAAGSISDHTGSYLPSVREKPGSVAADSLNPCDVVHESTALVENTNTTQDTTTDSEPKLIHDVDDIRRLSEEFSIYDNSPEDIPAAPKPMEPVPEDADMWTASVQALDLKMSKSSAGLLCKTRESDIPARHSPTDSGNGSLCNGSDNVDVPAAEAGPSDTVSDEEVKVPADYKEHLKANLKENELAANKQQLVHQNEIRVDNNFLLLLMLQVFQDEEEKFTKMFATSMGHQDGEWEPVYFLITSVAFYILKPRAGDVKFHKIAAVKFDELEKIALGINSHLMHIVCRNRRIQYWVTTGDERLTRCIIHELDAAMTECELGLCVLTDPMAQKIALKKWVTKEAKVKGKWTLPYYGLVHWQDSQSRSSGHSGLGIQREGTLLYKTNSYLDYVPLLGGATWKPGYFILRDGMLLQYSDKLRTNRVPQQVLQLSGGECCGCRRSRNSDRDNAFELLLMDGTTLEMSAATGEEVQEWLQALCQAVADGLQMTSNSVGCLACVCIMTSSMILMCHEDPQTNFFRTLGSAEIVDVTALHIDPVVRTYLVLMFESSDPNVSSDNWAVFFISETERDKFVCSVSQWWGSHYQVPLPVTMLEDATIQRQCRETATRVNVTNKLTMKL